MIDGGYQVKGNILFFRKSISKKDFIFFLFDDIAEGMSILKMNVFVLFLYNCDDELSILESFNCDDELLIFSRTVFNWMKVIASSIVAFIVGMLALFL